MTISYPDNTNNRNILSASGIVDNTFLDVVSNGNERKLSITELKKVANITVVDNVASLYALNYAIDNQLYVTRGYSTEGIGANIYRYDSGSVASIDYGFTLDGIGGNGSGTGVGRFIALDQTVADVTQFGAIGNGVVDDTTKIQAAVNAANNSTVYIPSGEYLISSTITLPAGAGGYTIRGDGSTSILLSNISNGTYILDTNAVGTLRLKNFLVQGVLTLQNCNGIDLGGSSRFSIEDVFVNRCRTGVTFSNSFIGRINNLFITRVDVGFTANALNNVTGDIKIENAAQYFDIDDTFGLHIDLLCEGEPHSIASTIDGSLNVTLSIYYEETGTGIVTSEFIKVGHTSDCANVSIRLNGNNKQSLSTAYTANGTTDTISASGHGFIDFAAAVFSSSATLPSGIVAGRQYFVRNSTDNTFQVALSRSGSITNIGDGSGNLFCYSTHSLVSLGDVYGCNVDLAGSLFYAKPIDINSSTRALTMNVANTINNPTRPGVVPASLSTYPAINYFPDAMLFSAYPTLSNSDATNTEELVIVPPFASRSIKVASNGNPVTSAFSYRSISFSGAPHLNNLKGKLVGIGWWQYYGESAQYSQIGTAAIGPDVRIATTGAASNTATGTRFSEHFPGEWQFNYSELTIPADATGITVYYYTARSSTQTADSSMISYFVGPLMWIGGSTLAWKVANGFFSHHPQALI